MPDLFGHEKIRTMTIFELLRKRYPSNEYALMEEVSDRAGFERSRSADFIAVNLWPSRGLAINGIELKSYRNDWLAELKKPEKAENIFQYCDYFWLLTRDETIAKEEEIPTAWGHLCVKGEKIVVKKEAPALNPLPLSKSFVCAMLKRANDKSNYVRREDIKDEIEKTKESAKIAKEWELKSMTEKHQKIVNILREFKEGSGIDLSSLEWNYNRNPKKIGEAVKFIEDNGLESIRNQLFGLEKTAQIVLDRISTAFKQTSESASSSESELSEHSSQESE